MNRLHSVGPLAAHQRGCRPGRAGGGERIQAEQEGPGGEKGSASGGRRMRWPPTSEAGAAMFPGRRGRGTAPAREERGRGGGGAWGAPLGRWAWGSETPRAAAPPPGGLPGSGKSRRGEGEGEGSKTKTPTARPQPPPAPAAGVHSGPTLRPPHTPGRYKVFTRLRRPALSRAPQLPVPPARAHLAPQPEPRGGPCPRPGPGRPTTGHAGGGPLVARPLARFLSPLALRGKLPRSR